MNSNKTIVLINQVTGPLFIDIANAHLEAGWKVVLLTGSVEPTYTELNEHIKVVKLIKYRRNKSVLRIATWLFFYLQAYAHLLLKGKRYEKALIVTNPPIMPFVGGNLLPKKNIDFDVLIYDVYPDALGYFGYLKEDSRLFSYWDRQNNKCFKKAKRVITISNAMRNLLARNHDPDKIEIIYPWVDTSFIKPMAKEDNWFAKKHNLTDKTVVLYSGNMGVTHDLITVLQAAAEVQNSHPNIHFLMIGDGVQKKDLLAFKNQEQLENVSFLPYQDASVLPYSFGVADFGIVSLGSGAEGLSVPSKTFYMLAAGAAILCISEANSEVSHLVVENSCGLSVEPSKKDQLVDQLCLLTTDKIAKFKKNARYLSLSFTPDNAKNFL